MNISRLLLSPADMLKLKITDAYSIHRVVYDCFPQQEPGATRPDDAGFLYADMGSRRGVREVLMLSSRPPLPPPGGVLETKVLPPDLLDFPAYSFSITINPVKRENRSGKIVPIKGRDAIRQWFCEKAPAWGFVVAPQGCSVDAAGVWAFTKKNTPVTLAFATISGTLRVADREKFIAAFTRGIGRAKAFGCGMLRILPLVRAG